MEKEGVMVCQKHQKREKNMTMISNSYYICMNRYCPDAYKILCSSCKQDHRDHTISLLSIEDLCFLIDRLLKMPFRQVGIYMSDTVEVMKKLQLIRQFKAKIDTLQNDIQSQTFSLIETTENLIGEYAICKKAAHETADVMFQIEEPENFKIFKQKTISNLSRMDYNFQKDMMEYGSAQIKQKIDIRKKIARDLRRKIQQVKQYSMKIIEVILNDDQSDEEEQDDLYLKKKQYQALKNQITEMKENQEKHSQESIVKNNEIGKKTSASQFEEMRPVAKKNVKNVSIQTDKEKIREKQKEKEEQFNSRYRQLESKMEMVINNNRKQQNQFRNKIMILQKEKENIVKEKDLLMKEKQRLKKENEKVVKANDKKNDLLVHFEKRLRDNRAKRVHRMHEKEDIIKRLIQLVDQQRKQSRSKQKSSKELENQKMNMEKTKGTEIRRSATKKI